MLKEETEKQIEKTLENAGYVVCNYKGCFDIAAKKEKLLLLKILQNVDSFSEEQAKNLKIIANNLDAVAILIGKNTTREKLKEGIVYERFELPCLSPNTLTSMISYKIFPTMYRDRGGLYVKIDSEIMKEAREHKKLTQRELAEIVGINKKVIYEHEKTQLRMILKIAQKLESTLDKKIIKPINILENKSRNVETRPSDAMEKSVGSELKKIGFKVDYVKQAPFNVFAKEKTLIISDVEAGKRRILKRAVDLKEFIKTVERPAILITELKEDSLEGIPIIQKKEIKELSPKEVIKIAKKIKG